MERAAFEAGLARDGFLETVERDLAPSEATPEHRHPFDARLLILSGSLVLAQGEARHSYGPGEVFDVPRDAPHAEIAGPEGASYLAGRRR
ncbi:cupin domain-containing protein [Falsiroseomonas tokyonensis]|uniref:Cupin domain-containing protein n=1 Tax=Falsiroseomonas tokyonensis TaxID=430521 RepID=A0ABV7C4B3_9PROT|nr:cupin domain-containing protein [Falsiroseomonas tokyonensis]MBU8541256.1 cupin domain-containing protein [Falsiroseomonas tokyonensis]